MYLDLRIYICRVMGQLEQFAQRTFADKTGRITGAGVGWEDPPEIRLGKVLADGLLVIRQPQLLEHLPPPWPEAWPDEEVMLELHHVTATTSAANSGRS